MSKATATNTPLEELARHKIETRALLRKQLEEDTLQNIEKGKVWVWGEWVPQGVSSEVNRQIARRGLVIFLETLAVIFLLWLVAACSWILLCFIITPYPPNPRAGMVSQTLEAQ